MQEDDADVDAQILGKFAGVHFGPHYQRSSLCEFSRESGRAFVSSRFCRLFFNILHPPLNVPALAVSLNEDVDTNKELTAHGYSNVIAGLLGTPPNYLVYVNTLL